MHNRSRWLEKLLANMFIANEKLLSGGVEKSLFKRQVRILFARNAASLIIKHLLGAFIMSQLCQFLLQFVHLLIKGIIKMHRGETAAKLHVNLDEVVDFFYFFKISFFCLVMV